MMENSENISNDNIMKEVADFIINILRNKNKILIFTIVGLLFGLLSVVSTSKTYTVSTVIVPQYSKQTSSKDLSALASIAGISLETEENTGEISPLLYSQVINSVPFQFELMNIPFNFKNQDSAVSILEYYSNIAKPTLSSQLLKYSIELPSTILSFFRQKRTEISQINTNSKIFQLTIDEYKVYSILKSHIDIIVDTKDGYLTITATMPEPLVAAEVCKKTLDLLEKYVIKFKTQKSIEDLEFILNRYNESKVDLDKKQILVAENIDKTKFITSDKDRISVKKAETDFNISNAVFLELAKQLEQAKIQVKKDTPIFTILQPVYIPIESNGIGNLKRIFISIILGFVLGCIYVYFENQILLILKTQQSGK